MATAARRAGYAMIVVALMSACGPETPGEQTVAAVGEKRITFDDFLYDFTISPQFRTNSTLREARLQHLDHMERQVHLQMASETERLDTLGLVRDRMDYIRRRETLRTLYNRDILSGIPVTDEEAWEEYKRSNLELDIRHLFVETREEAASLQAALAAGADFAALAGQVFRDSALAAAGGRLGFIPLLEFDPFLVDSLYNLRVGEVSGPLRSTEGWHIVRIEDVKQSLFLSREYFDAHKADFVRSLRKRRAEYESRRYLADVLEGKSLNIKPAVLDSLLRVSRRTVRLRSPGEAQRPVPNITDRELRDFFRGSEALFEEILVTFTGGEWTVGEFLGRLKDMPPLQRPVVNRRQLLIRNLIDMVRDELLYDEAVAKDYHRLPEVEDEVARWRRIVLANEFEKRLLLVDYQRADSAAWASRRALFARIREAHPAEVDTSVLFQDVPAGRLDERIPKINLVIRQHYNW